ncbi:inositol monophosphatase family protein [Corticimicrobacter populi]|uniref:Inositol-1-monophosphatase n=1 Tax=Corticimicrobacter populi TaxID=2175229 RepID=A0A2V1JYY0_9BURK|nr:inositol monophosphatase family protein [Corticimicrobacter populi]PWF22479.1 inositol monophosphatase [Corticimicrobacter populi]
MTDTVSTTSLNAALNLPQALDAATQAAHAGAAILQAHAYRRADLIIDHKARNDLVSQADRDAEQTIVDILTRLTPQYGLIAEETGGQTHGQATWYIDPLDGTTNFLHGIPHYAVSIALIAHAGTAIAPDVVVTEDTPVVAVVYDPSREEMFTAVHGGGTRLNSQRVQCSRTDALADALLATGLPFRDFSFADEYMPMLDQAIHQTRGVRRLGAAALDLAWVACGRFDGYWELGLAPWDVAAGTLLVREAGGIATDLRGRDPWPIKGDVISGGRHLHPLLCGMVEPYLQRG